MSISKKLLQAAAGNAGEFVYVEDVFSTYLYTGNGTSQTITNDIDLDGEGGLVWSKARTSTSAPALYDTERGASKEISSSSTVAESSDNGVTAFNSDGYVIGNRHTTNSSGVDYASWTFRKAEKFFDVVAYTGTGTSNRKLAHNLGDIPGCVIIKSTNDTTNWKLWHGNLGDNWLELNNVSGVSAETYFQSAPTDTELSLSANGNVNGSGKTYIAYFFASEAGGFGDDENIIKCGSYTGTGSSLDVDLGFEPQWIFIKNSSGGHGAIYDVMRQKYLAADLTNAETSFWSYPSPPIMPRATGITIDDTNVTVNASGNTYIYIAIRRPMKTPESGTEVFKPNYVDNGASSPDSISGFPVDMYFRRYVNTTNDTYLLTRLTSPNALKTNGTDAEAAFSSSSAGFDYQNGVMNIFSSDNSDFHTWMFKRATGFFDVVAYSGTGSATTVSHNLGVVPELIIEKRRDGVAAWLIYNQTSGNTKYLQFTTAAEATSAAAWNNTSPTSTQFTVGIGASVSGGTHIAYLFATLAGVSKVGSYTGTGSNVDVDCGFSAGARFILIKRTDSTGDWYVWDSERGIVAGNDPYLLLNSTAAEVTSTDYIDPLSSGFTVTSSAPAALNASGGSYIFLAIA